MRIALIPSAYAPLVGGVEELSHRLARHLLLAGDDVEVWTTQPGGAPSEEKLAGITVRRFSMPMPPAKLGPVARFPLSGGRALIGLMRAVRAFKPDLLHVHCFSVNGAYATLASRLGRVPLVISLHGETMMDDHDIFDRAVSLRAALRLGFRRARAVTACSQFVLDDAITRFGLAPALGQVIFNGVEISDDVEPAAVPIPFQRFVACLGRMVHKKGIDLLLDALPSVAQRVPDVGLVVGGQGPSEPELKQRVHDLGLADRVHFTGLLDRAGVSWVMQNAEVLVMPSRIEPFGIVALEAWRAGCPVIVSSVGGAPEFVRNGIDGLVVDPTNPAMLGDALHALLSDASMRRRMSRQSQERVMDFTWPVITARYREVYERVLRQRDRPQGTSVCHAGKHSG